MSEKLRIFFSTMNFLCLHVCDGYLSELQYANTLKTEGNKKLILVSK